MLVGIVLAVVGWWFSFLFALLQAFCVLVPISWVSSMAMLASKLGWDLPTNEEGVRVVVRQGDDVSAWLSAGPPITATKMVGGVEEGMVLRRIDALDAQKATLPMLAHMVENATKPITLLFQQQDSQYSAELISRSLASSPSRPSKPRQGGDEDSAAARTARHQGDGGRPGCFSDLSFEDLRARLAAFAKERDWDQFHTPRNLALAMVGEVGEVAECLQWKSDAECSRGLPDWSTSAREHLGEELSDVLLYLFRLSDMCGVDLPAAALDKLTKNAAKYPADKARGSAKKYNEL